MGRHVLLDIDNCIANDGWRIPRIDWSTDDRMRRYHAYHMLAPWDACSNLDLFCGREDIVIVTCRPLHYRASTVEWLHRHGVTFKHLLMRNDHDNRSSVAVKRSYLDSLWDYGVVPSNIEAAFDDRQEVIDMYLSCGIRGARRRWIHEVCAYVNPITKENHANGKQA